MRVTLNQSYATTIRNIQNRSSDHQRAIEIATTGKQVDAPSSDPTGYARVMGGRSRIHVLDTYTRNLNFAVSEANFVDSALQSAQTALTQITERANAGVSETLSDDERQLYAIEIRSLGETIRRAANSEFNGRLVFGGGQQEGEVFNDAGVYQGGNEPPELLAGDDYLLSTGLAGDEIFGAAGGVDIFALIDDIATSLETGDTDAAHARMDDLGSAIDQLSGSRAFYGALTNHADALIGLYQDAGLRETEATSHIEDADMVVALSDLARLDTAFQATLQASGKVGRRTLFEYL